MALEFTPRDILRFRVSEMVFLVVFKRFFPTADAMLIHRNTRKTANNAIEMSQAFHDITWFKYAFNVIQTW